MKRFSVCVLAAATASLSWGRTLTSLSGGGWTCDGEPVSVPHTWNATDACDGPGETVRQWTGSKGGDSVGGLGYLKKRAVYRRTLPAKRDGRRYFLRFEGASVVTDVRIDDRDVGSHIGAFTGFTFEVTDFLKTDGDSRLEVAVDNRWRDDTQPMAADYSVYGGLYRDVWLLETDRVCIDPVTDGADGVIVSADPKTGEVAVSVAVLGGTNEVQRFRVENHELWSPEHPKLYTRRIAVDQLGSHDEIDVRFGFRTFEFRDGLFYLNGRQRQLRGVNRHQDRAGKGWAVSAADEEEDLRLIKEMGADALRTAHYPASRHVYDLCDELGIVAWCEYPNVNRLTFSDAFETNMLRQVREMVMQRRNHASIGQWGIFNELYNGESWMRPKSAELLAMMSRTQDFILSLDRTRTVVGVMGEAGVPALNVIPQEYGLNVYPKWYSFMTMREMLDYQFALSGRKTFAISEYGVGASVKQHGDPTVAVRSAGMWHPEEYQAYRMHDNLLELMREPRVWGTYVWAMFDFGADNRMEGDRHGINDKGLVTHDRKVLKDCYYMYQALWTKKPVLRLVGSRMTTLTNDVISVMGFSNVGPVTLTVNGRDLGTRTPDAACGVLWSDVRLRDGDNRVELKAGELSACAHWEKMPDPSAKLDLTNVFPAGIKCVHLVAPSSLPPVATIVKTTNALVRAGYKVKVSPGVWTYAADGAQRARDLEAAWSDPETDLILCGRGGRGGYDTVTNLNFSVLKSRDIPFVGFSNISCLLNAFVAKGVGRPISGPMCTSMVGYPTTRDSLDRLSTTVAGGELAPTRLTVLRPAAKTVSGLPIGGHWPSLSRMTRDWLPSTDGRVIFLEVNKTYTSEKAKACFLKLAETGYFARPAAVVLCDLGITGTREERAALERFLVDALACPVFKGYPYGHVRRCYAIDYGRPVEITPDGELSWK